MVNRVILIGNLGADPEVRRLENGAVVAKVRLATNENYKDRSGEWQTLTEWHDVVMWRTLAERAESQLKTGTQVYIEGKLTHRTWQDQDGNNRKTTEVVASYFRMVGGKRDNNSGGGGYFPSPEDEQKMGNMQRSTPETATTSQSQSDADTGNISKEPAGGNTAEDDLPF
ncbi:single-stranded DNA-binding protein [Phaeodactylibacter xiamenensis]|jgi:single-strand DNA-binding protein|uniref:single-stranded DNA-binding protein n=1 Tax=Phaeodactylibacter xiamenensis TaxID=1524460 RepID=UPI0024A86BCA|nr:single-stranded DNA-binding protein [Phaeodactylibacter xiamenensis]